jgi:hypothetical protein
MQADSWALCAGVNGIEQTCVVALLVSDNLFKVAGMLVVGVGILALGFVLWSAGLLQHLFWGARLGPQTGMLVLLLAPFALIVGGILVAMGSLVLQRRRTRSQRK